MGLLSIINLKKDFVKFKELFSTENITKLKTYINQQIVSYVDSSDLLGAEKKAKVDEAVVTYIKNNFKSSNSIITVCVNLLLQYEPVLTQFIYNDLKSYVAGLTTTTV